MLRKRTPRAPLLRSLSIWKQKMHLLSQPREVMRTATGFLRYVAGGGR